MDKDNRILLVLDLDETLIHASETELTSLKHDFTWNNFFVYKRPGLDEFLNSIKDHFKIGVWSSASDDYVGSITSNIFPESLKLEFIWGRSRCTLKRDLELDTYFFSKPLKRLKRKGYQLERILIIDDSAEKVKDNFGNAIYITGFTGAPDDVLKRLSLYLQKLIEAPNVRTIEKRGWHLQDH
jgi:RNA polymerase II subunit A small phosphatase-like protein